jgi:hypothetical protein
MGDGGVDDGRFRWASDLGEVGEESGEIEESTVKCLSALTLYGVMSCSTFSSISAPAGLSFYLTMFL